MYPSTVRELYSRLFKLAEAQLPVAVRAATVEKVAASDRLVAQELARLWSQP